MSEFSTNMTVVTEVSLIVSKIQGDQVSFDPYSKAPKSQVKYLTFLLVEKMFLFSYSKKCIVT